MQERYQAPQHIMVEIIDLACQPDIWAALQNRRDPQEAMGDVATRYAFSQLMVEKRDYRELDDLSRQLIHERLDNIHRRAANLALRRGEDPLIVEPGLLFKICEHLANYVPIKPMGVYIHGELNRPENEVMRAMRQIKNLVTHERVREAFIAFMLDASADDELKGQLLQMARSGRLSGVNYEATIIFFAQPETMAFVLRFADRVQTARTLYCQEAYRCNVPADGLLSDPVFRRLMIAHLEEAPLDAGLRRRIVHELQQPEPCLDTESMEQLLELPTIRSFVENYAQDCEELPWRGRRLPKGVRRGYVEAALATIRDQQVYPLDTLGIDAEPEERQVAERAFAWAPHDEQDARFSSYRSIDIIA